MWGVNDSFRIGTVSAGGASHAVAVAWEVAFPRLRASAMWLLFLIALTSTLWCGTHTRTVWRWMIGLPYGGDSLTMAVMAGDINGVRAALEDGASANDSVNGYPLLTIAAGQHHPAIVRVLLEH